MLFRPLGKTGLRLSEIGLGGHWPTATGLRYQDRFPDDEVPSVVAANRAEVISACLDVGINYIDITTAAEALAYGQVLVGRRDRFIIGADDYQWSARNSKSINVSDLTANVERCLTRLRTDYLDIWRVTAAVHGQNMNAEIEAVVETANRLRSSGKIRYLGISSHHAGWLRRVVEQWSALDLVLMPCVPVGSEVNDEADQAFTAATQHSLGVIGIKPFAGGMLFGSDSSGPKSLDTLARLALRWLLQNRQEITSIVPGMATVAHVHNAAAAINAGPLSSDELGNLRDAVHAALQMLPPTYAWLQCWA